jgi:hypothetical protein
VRDAAGGQRHLALQQVAFVAGDHDRDFPAGL